MESSRLRGAGRDRPGWPTFLERSKPKPLDLKLLAPLVRIARDMAGCDVRQRTATGLPVLIVPECRSESQPPEWRPTGRAVLRHLQTLPSAAGPDCWREGLFSPAIEIRLPPPSRRPSSQAGRRGFESRLPLHLFNRLDASPNQLLSHLSQLEVNGSDSSALKSDQSADDASRLRASDESTYSAK